MADNARELTDKRLAVMSKRLTSEYKTAQKDLSDRFSKYMSESEKRLESLKTALSEAAKSGDKKAIAKAEKALAQAKMDMTIGNKRYREMIDDLTTKMAEVNQTALDYVNGQMSYIYRVNYNQGRDAADEIGMSFSAMNEEAVARRVRDGDIKLPKKKMSIPEDKRWNTKQLNSAVIQGIMQGESMDKIAKRILPVVDNNRNAAIRNARTMVTGAENEGRQDCWEQLAEDGAVLKRVWISTPDSRTREAHLFMDGQEVDLDEPFVDGDGNQLNFPGDPTAAPETVYNCRCSMRVKVIGFRKSNGDIVRVADRDRQGMHQKAIEREREKREAEEKPSNELAPIVASIKDKMLSTDIWHGDVTEEAKRYLTDSIDSITDKQMLETINTTLDKVGIHWSNEEGTSHHTYGTSSISMYESGKNHEEITRVFWHEYGHYVDDSASGSDYKFELYKGYEAHGISMQAENDKKYGEAACKDINAFLEKAGLSDKYEMTIRDEYSSHWLKYKDTGESVDIQNMPYEDHKELNEALRKWFDNESGMTAALNYMTDHGYPKDVKYEDYMQAYYTPKRHTLKYKEKFKGAEEKYYEDSRKVLDLREEFRKRSDYKDLRAEEERLYKQAQQNEKALGWVTDTFDGGAWGAFTSVIYGGHTADYYARNFNGIKEGTANVFMSLATHDPVVEQGMKDLCPNIYELLKGIILKEGK